MRNNNCCETKNFTTVICLLFTNPFLAAGWPDYGFVNNKQVAFLQIFISPKLLFLFLKLLDKMSNVTNCDPGQTNLWFRLNKKFRGLNFQIQLLVLHFSEEKYEKTQDILEIRNKFFSLHTYKYRQFEWNFETFTYLDMLIFCFFVNKIFMLNEIVYLVRFLEWENQMSKI